jgi:hypothetical protein
MLTSSFNQNYYDNNVSYKIDGPEKSACSQFAADDKLSSHNKERHNTISALL